jgi:hypothetical protein
MLSGNEVPTTSHFITDVHHIASLYMQAYEHPRPGFDAQQRQSIFPVAFVGDHLGPALRPTQPLIHG